MSLFLCLGFFSWSPGRGHPSLMRWLTGPGEKVEDAAWGKGRPSQCHPGGGQRLPAPAGPGPIQEVHTLAGLPAAKRPWPGRVRVRASESKARPQGHLFPTGPGAHSTWHLVDGGGGEGASFGKSAILGGFAVTRGCQGLRGLSGQLLPPRLLGCLKTEAQGAWDLIVSPGEGLLSAVPAQTHSCPLCPQPAAA